MSKNNSLLIICLLLLAMPAFITGQNIVKDVQVDAEQATFEMLEKDAQSLLLEIAGPDEYYFKQEIDVTSEINISNQRADGEVFPDGQYSLQVTPIIKLDKDLLEELVELRNNRDALAIQQFREKHGLPENVDAYNYNFSIKNGKFVYAKLNEKAVAFDRELEKMDIEHPDLYASTHRIEMNSTLRLQEDNTSFFDQVFLDDVIVSGSLCVGQDCNNGENFGFDTQRLKENNLRINFDDTSTSASFPRRDWRIVINDSSNGGAEYFGIEDVTAGRFPFRILGGAPANSLYVDAQGDVGIGTASPVVELQVTDGDTPTLRLEQNGSAGFGTQTWDIAGNETNFFVRDATNGSKLPFKIKPGAPDNSLYIDAEGDIGLGTANPGTNGLQVESGNVYVKAGNLGVNVVPTVALDVVGSSKFAGPAIFQGDPSFFLTTGTTFLNSGFTSVLRIDATNARVGIGTAMPAHQLELSVDDAAKPNGGAWTAASDRRLKENIESFSDGLDVVLKMKPVRYNYNGELGYPTDKKFIGIIAQDMQKIAPYTIRSLNKGDASKNYLAYDGTPVTYLLVNAIQEQQKIINQQNEEIVELSNKVDEIAELKKMMATLSQQVAELTQNISKENNPKSTSTEREE